ncbi:Na+/H+ antiporter subunit E [bacterium]|nr:Na+/H+ antiporter subunit E [bacterium]
MRPFICLSAGLLALWLILTWSLDPQEVAAGIVVSLVIAGIARGAVQSVTSCPSSVLKRIAYLIAYIPYLLVAIVAANIDVAKRVVNPRLPIRPGIVKVRTNLKSPLGRLFLTSSITLTPGTLTVEISGRELYIHWIDVEAEGVEEASERIVRGFERYLEHIFG